jgi:hypothetical protein
MPTFTLTEIVILLLLFSGFVAGLYLAVRLARRPSPPNEGR